MKIAFIIKSFPKIAETFILNQITGVIDLGHDVEIFSFNRTSEEIIQSDVLKYDLQNKVIYLNAYKPKHTFAFKLFKSVAKIIFLKPKIIFNSFKISRNNDMPLALFLYQVSRFLSKKFDVIHCFYGPTGIFGIALKEIGVFKGKIITSFHGYDVSKYLSSSKAISYDLLFEKGDLFLPVCDFLKQKLIQLGCPENKITVHRTGINLEKFQYNSNVKSFYGKIKLLTVGRLIEKKGINYGIIAFKNLLKKYPLLEYDIIGEGPLRLNINKLIQDYKLTQNIKVHGLKVHDEVVKYIENSDILIAPSLRASNEDEEGIPNVIKEAMATGTPVISTYHGGIPELVKDGFSGFLVEEKDAEAIESKVVFLIENPQLRKDFAVNGRKQIERHYDIKKLNNELVNIYKKLISR